MAQAAGKYGRFFPDWSEGLPKVGQQVVNDWVLPIDGDNYDWLGEIPMA